MLLIAIFVNDHSKFNKQVNSNGNKKHEEFKKFFNNQKKIKSNVKILIRFKILINVIFLKFFMKRYKGIKKVTIKKVLIKNVKLQIKVKTDKAFKLKLLYNL